jgi:hypothetical protein
MAFPYITFKIEYVAFDPFLNCEARIYRSCSGLDGDDVIEAFTANFYALQKKHTLLKVINQGIITAVGYKPTSMELSIFDAKMNLAVCSANVLLLQQLQDPTLLSITQTLNQEFNTSPKEDAWTKLKTMVEEAKNAK